jgi:hypothetical protein
MKADPNKPYFGVPPQIQETPGATAFIQAMHELLPGVIAEIERATGQEKQTGAILDGFASDLAKVRNAQVPTEIRCPKCGMLHVDQDEWATTRLHRKHLCHGCGNIWQPYPVTTVGVDYHVGCNERINQLDYDLAWTKAQWQEAGAEIETLTKRRDELLEMVAKLSQTVPLESEVAEALNQRGALLAEVGTLKARIVELESMLPARAQP